MEFKSSLDIPHPLLVVTQTQLSKIFFKMLVIPLSICSITLIFDIKATLRNPFIGIRKWQDSDSQKSSLEFNFGFFFFLVMKPKLKFCYYLKRWISMITLMSPSHVSSTCAKDFSQFSCQWSFIPFVPKIMSLFYKTFQI